MRHSLLQLPILALCLMLAGCGNDADEPEHHPTACSPALARVDLPDARLRADDFVLRDALGRDVVMRGLNTGGRSKFEPFLPFPVNVGDGPEEIRAEADAYFSRLLGWGLDTVRMPFSWEALEPEPGVFDPNYLERYEVMVDSAWDHGLRVIVDFHQDIFASPFCGDGFPPWTVEDLASGPARHDCPTWFMSYFNDPDVQEAFDRFWSNETGIQTRFAEMWTMMARRFAEHPGVVGFEIINEPHPGTTEDEEMWKREVLAPFYEVMAADLQSIAPEVLVFYDGTGTDGPNPDAAYHFRPRGEGLVFAPHYYDGTVLMGVGWTGELPHPHIEALADFGVESGVPVLLGEFGYPDGVPRGDEWLAHTMDALDEQRLSATLWEYSVSHELWNGENLSVVDGDGQERAVLDVYVRPWLRAVAGTDASFLWDRENGRATATWTATDGVSEIVVPRRLFPEGPTELVTEGEGACQTWDANRGELRVAAPAGTIVTVRISL